MPITDRYDSFTPDLTGPAISGFDVAPDDGVDLATLPRALMVTDAGDVAVQFADGTAITLPGLTPGVIYPLRPCRIMATGTTATGIKGLV